MWSLHAFSATTSAATALTNVAPAADPGIAINGNFLFVPNLSQLIGVYAIGANLQRLQLTSPSLLADVPYDVTPIDVSTLPSSPMPLHLDTTSPIPLVTDEPLQALYTQSASGYVSAFTFLSDGPIAPVTGKIIRCRATVTTPSTGYVWTNAALTLSNQLAEGNYQLVGARIEDSHTLAARFVFPGSNNSVRPGMIAVGTAAKFDAQHLFRDGNLGVWGEFSNRVLPTIDILNDGTSQTATVILDLIKK